MSRATFLRLIGSLLSGGLLIFLVVQNWGDVTAALARLSAQELLTAFGLILLSRLFITLRWHVLLRAGGVAIPLRETVSLVFTGLFASNFLPTTIGGDVVRLAGAMQRGYDRAVCLASIAADRVINMLGMSLAAPLGLIQVFGGGLPLALAFSAQDDKENLFSRGVNFIRRTLQSFSLWFKKPGALALALTFALAHMLCTFGASAVLLSALGESADFWRLIGLLSLAYFITLFPISINGYGLQEFSVTYLLSTFAGISLPVSAMLALLHRLLMMAASLPGALTLPEVLAKMDKSQP
ncbi:MAG: hypothetical protein Fur0035_18210 [Anaerolineales bacterium]